MSLLKQFVQKQSSLPDQVKDLYNRHEGKKTRPSFNEIVEILNSVVRDYTRAFIIIDALDECQDIDSEKFLFETFSLQAKTEANLFATSQFNPKIMKKFEASISMEIRADDENVRRYVAGHISDLPSFVSDSLELQEEIKAGIIKAVDGMCVLLMPP